MITLCQCAAAGAELGEGDPRGMWTLKEFVVVGVQGLTVESGA